MPLFEVSTPDGKKYEVNTPDGSTQEDAIAYVKENLWKPEPQKTKPKEGLLSNLQRGAESTIGDIRTGFAGVLNPTEAAQKGLEREDEMRQRLGPQESRLSKVEKAYTDKGLLSAIGTGLGEIPGAITEQIPQLVTAFGSARVGAMLGAPAGPVGATIGAVGGAFLPFFFQQYGGNIKQQADVQKEKGETVDVSGVKGAAFAVPMAGLEVAASFIPFGKQIVGKMFGPSVEKLLNRGLTKEAEEAVAKKLSQESFLPSLKNMDLGTVVKGTSKTALLEMPTEITQQILGRVQSGQDLFSPEAMRSYGETAFDVALLGPLGIYGRGVDKSAARQTILKAQQDALKAGEPQQVSIDTTNDRGEVEQNTFYVDSKGAIGKSLDDFQFKGEMEKRTAELQAVNQPASKAVNDIEARNPEVIYSGSLGVSGENPDAVQQEEYFKQLALEKTDRLNNTLYPELLKSWGIRGKAIILQDVMDKDIRDPVNASIVKAALLEQKKKTTSKTVKDNIDEFLSRPEFSPEKIGEEAGVTPPAPPALKPIINTAKANPVGNEVWQFIQNRDRSTDASVNQMNIIASNPQYDRASFSNSFTEGAPVVSGDMTIPENQLGRKGNIVTGDNQKIPVQYAIIDASQVMPSHNVNGSKNADYISPDYKGLRAITNGRVAGLQAGYARGTMDDYVTDLTFDDMHGISKDVIKSIKNPMLVRVMPSEIINKHTGDVSNTGAGLSLNVVEQAKNDINRINLEGIEFGENGEVTEKSVRELIRAMPQTEQNNLMTKDGTPSKQAYDRLNAAIFQQAYQNDKLTELAFQSPDEEIKNIVRALNMAAPSAIDLDGLDDYDIRPFVNEAVEMAINAKRNSISLSNLVKQSDMTIHPLSKDILEMFSNNPRSARAIGENLNTLFDNAYKEGSQSADMFGEVQKKPIYQVIKDSFTKKPEEDLFTPKEEKSTKKTAPPKLTPPSGFELKKGRNEQVVLAARELAAKRITKEEFDAYVDYYMPINTVLGDKLEAPIEDNLMKDILLNKIKQKKKPELINASINDGTKVGLRMDIPALDWGRENGVNGSVVSIHKGSNPDNATQGENIGYKSTGALKNVVFATRSQETAFKIAQQLAPEVKTNKKTGKEYIKDVASKSPQQTIEGNWVNMSPSETMRLIKENLNNPEWKQISLDPLRHSYFYDRDSRQPVVAADEVLQVGRFVLAKNVKFANRKDFLYDITPTDKFKGDIKEVQKRLRKSLDDLGLKGTSLRVSENLQAIIDGKKTTVSGKYFKNLITVALNSPNPLKTLHHESIHALKDLGMFSDAEWAVLEKAAEDKWIKQYGIEDRYKGFSREVKIEEAIANAFPEFMQMGKVEKSIYQRVKDFFSRVRNVFRGMGYMTSDMAFNRTPEAVFQKVKENKLTGDKEIKDGGMRFEKATDFNAENPDIRYEISLDGVNPAAAKEIQSIFGPTPKITISEKFKELRPNFYNRILTGLFDEFRPIKNYGEEAYMKAALSKTTDGALEGLLMHGHVTLKDGALDIKQGTKGLLDILKPLGADVERYQVWKALNRDAEIAKKRAQWEALEPSERKKIKEPPKTSFSADLLNQRNELLNGNIDGVPRKQVYQKVLNEENALNRSVLNVAKAQGIIDDEAYERFANDIYYIPFYEKMENGELTSVQDSAKLTGQSFSKALKGGQKEKMGDLMENTLRNWSHILSASMKNAAAVSTLDSAVNLKAATRVKSTYDGKDLLTVMKDGKKAYYAVTDPALVESISMISFLGPKSPFLDVAKGFTNALRFGVTLSPGYKVRNLIRDTITSAGVSPVGMNIFDNVQRGLKLSDKGNPTYVSAMAGGGVFELGAAHEGDQAALVKRLIKKGVNPETILSDAGQIKNILKDMYEKYNELGNRFENANRLALYDKMIKEGKTHLEASYAARDLLNFTGQGSWKAVKFVSQVVPFFNTRLQGLYKLGRDGISPTSRVLCNMATGKPIEESDKLKAQRFSIVSSAVALASIGLYMAYEDDEDFKKREDWDRDNFWWFKVDDVAYRIPKPFEIGSLGTIAERAVEQIRDENVEGKVFYDRLRSVIMDTLSLDPTPQFVKPLIDIYANKDSFTNAPIESTGMERLSKQERVTNNTSELAKALGGVSQGAAKIVTLNPEAQGFSPVQMDYALKAYFGWLGSTVAIVSDKAVQPWSDVEKPGRPALDQYSLGFAKSLPETQSKYVTNFYNNSKRINEAFADMKRYAEQGEMEKVANIMAEKGDLIQLQGVYNQTTAQMAEYRKYINIITNDKTMSKEDKENQITRMKVLISQLAENAEDIRKSLKK